MARSILSENCRHRPRPCEADTVLAASRNGWHDHVCAMMAAAANMAAPWHAVMLLLVTCAPKHLAYEQAQAFSWKLKPGRQ